MLAEKDFVMGFHSEVSEMSLRQFPVPTDVINLCGKIRIRKSYHYGGQAM